MPEYVDPDSGEVLEIPEGQDALFWAAQRLIEADDQRKGWERRAAVCKSLILKDQPDARAVYGDVSVSVRQSMRSGFDKERFRSYARDAVLDAHAFEALVLAAKDFDLGALPPEIRLMVETFLTKTPTRSFVIAERVLRLAPS